MVHGDRSATSACLKIGSKDQPVLAKRGDDIRIDWGYLYVAAPKSAVAVTHGRRPRRRASTASPTNGLRRRRDPSTGPGSRRRTRWWRRWLSRSARCRKQPVSRWLMLAYDDLYSIQYMKKNLRPYWRRNGWEAADLLKAAAKDYESLQKRCAAFDEELMADLTKAGGEKYAKLCALAYRQCFAAGKFVADDNGQPICSSARRTTPTAASAPRTCSTRWPRSSCCSGRRWPSRSSCRS